jgi:hypothetical protein
MSGDRPLAERSRIYVRPFNGLRAAISSALSIYTLLFPAAVHAAANELDNDYFALVVEEILDRGFPCSSGSCASPGRFTRLSTFTIWRAS